ncbi:hypothetical protein BJ875DRAFT_461715 [Amylocarpus encephaloides]|uniref:Dystroglycan-type cadherin-like domain-containing protein n=1 Tax=Amylocarpus encephaloides TaxID=45428 RepID=A0A9P8C6U1_9HELO|nr:hypothetical protein BJ875DRAFT_461715 [Amylocarpus encephaloides]
MLLMMSLGIFIFVIAVTNIVSGLPSIDFPLNSQIPSIARVSKPFSYTFPASTFSSTLPIAYTLSSGPSWLSLDNTTRTLSGTPSSEDVGPETVTVVDLSLSATDSSGSTTMSSTLVISKSPAPVVEKPASSQLPAFSNFSAPSTLIHLPSTPFEFSFDSNTFKSVANSKLNYYAVSVDHTPMPSWVVFDGSSLTFSGQTPDVASLIQPPQNFGIRLIATDIQEFAAAILDFNIEVGVHQLYFSRTSMTINATAGGVVNFTGLSNNLLLDGQLANASVISSISVDSPRWLAFNNSTLLLAGTAPADGTSANITAIARDTYGDVANATIQLRFSTPIFSKQIPTLNATIDSGYTYNLSSYLYNPSDVEITMTSEPRESWVSFEPLSLLLSGEIPKSVKVSDVDVTLKASSKSSGSSESQTFRLAVGASTISSAASPTSTAPPSDSSSTSTSIPLPASTSNKLSAKSILAVFLPLIVLLFALLAVLLCLRRRRQGESTRPSKAPSKSEISVPIESRSSIGEIVLPPPVAAPEPLQLDTSTFLDTSPSHGLTTNERLVSRPYLQRAAPPQYLRIRRSHTISGDGLERKSQAFVDVTRVSKTSNGVSISSNRARSYSENALSKTSKSESSWRSTQNSALLTLHSSCTISSHRLTRTYSNYSRKGHTRRSARILDLKTIGDLRKSTTDVLIIPTSPPPPSNFKQSESSILGLNDRTLSLTPLDSFSALGKGPILSPPDSTTSNVHRRPSLARNSRTWLTVAESSSGELIRRRSNVSAPSEYSDTYSPDTTAVPRPLGMSIRQVTKSPSISGSLNCRSPSSTNPRNSRPVSRRIGSSPFFGGGSVKRDPRFSPSKRRTSYADSPTVPEESAVFATFESTVLPRVREDTRQTSDSFGISYRLAREGTRQLRSYIEGQMQRSKTRGSVQSQDSRFESAPASSLGEDQGLPNIEVIGRDERMQGDGEYEDFLPEDYSNGSWQTHDSRESPIDAYLEEGEEEEEEEEVLEEPPHRELTARMGWKGRPNVVGEGRERDSRSGPRMVRGVGRRPISVDATAGGGLMESVRGRVAEGEQGGCGWVDEGDWSAYI